MWLNRFGKITAFKSGAGLLSGLWLGIIVCSLFLCAALHPVLAEIQAKAYDWQARLSRVIPERERGLCLEIADNWQEGSVEAMRSEIEAMDTRLPKTPLQLYTAIKILIRKDAAVTELKNNLRATQKGRELLEGYLSSLKRTRRIKGAQGKHIAEISERRRTIPINEESPEGTDVLRFLPAPEKTWTESEVRAVSKAARSDLEFLKAQEERLKAEAEAAEKECSPWHRFVDQTGRSLNPMTCLPKETVDTAGKPLHELIYPAPPFDLKPLQPEVQPEADAPGPG